VRRGGSPSLPPRMGARPGTAWDRIVGDVWSFDAAGEQTGVRPLESGPATPASDAGQSVPLPSVPRRHSTTSHEVEPGAFARSRRLVAWKRRREAADADLDRDALRDLPLRSDRHTFDADRDDAWSAQQHALSRSEPLVANVPDRHSGRHLMAGL